MTVYAVAAIAHRVHTYHKEVVFKFLFTDVDRVSRRSGSCYSQKLLVKTVFVVISGLQKSCIDRLAVEFQFNAL